MNDLKKHIDTLYEVTKKIDDSELIQVAKFLRQRIYQPDSYLVFLGESCSGKSTLINTIIGEKILPVSSIPSTSAISEVFFDRDTDEKEFFKINNNATMNRLTYSEFCILATTPNTNFERLRVTIPTNDENKFGIRIFDTPGYGSLIDEHDEVLFDFLPNCDAVVYTVSYKIGIQDDDYTFLQRLTELVRSGIPVYLLINRCPSDITKDDRRIREIVQYVSSLLETSEIPLFIIPSFKENIEENVKEQMNHFWNKVASDLQSEYRKKELYNAFKSYLMDLLKMIQFKLENNIRNIEINETEKALIKEEIKKLREKFSTAVENIVKPGFNRIKIQFPKCVEKSASIIKEETCIQIEKQSSFDKEETSAYINQHLLKFYAGKQVEELQFYLGQELNAIDKEVNDYLNKEIVQFGNDLEIGNVSAAGKAGIDAAKSFASHLLNAGLLKYFAKFGGAGGSGAGVANAASHTLKKIGDFFGKTFSRETHNALKQVLAKVGLTSTKAISVAGTAIIETASLIIDLSTWKPRLCKAVNKTLSSWSDDVTHIVLEDLVKLEEENIKHLENIAKEFENTFSEEETSDKNIDMLKEQLKVTKDVESEMI